MAGAGDHVLGVLHFHKGGWSSRRVAGITDGDALLDERAAHLRRRASRLVRRVAHRTWRHWRQAVFCVWTAEFGRFARGVRGAWVRGSDAFLGERAADLTLVAGVCVLRARGAGWGQASLCVWAAKLGGGAGRWRGWRWARRCWRCWRGARGEELDAFWSRGRVANSDSCVCSYSSADNLELVVERRLG